MCFGEVLCVSLGAYRIIRALALPRASAFALHERPVSRFSPEPALPRFLELPGRE